MDIPELRAEERMVGSAPASPRASSTDQAREAEARAAAAALPALAFLFKTALILFVAGGLAARRRGLGALPLRRRRPAGLFAG